jgi:hypothetical protein
MKKLLLQFSLFYKFCKKRRNSLIRNIRVNLTGSVACRK